MACKHLHMINPVTPNSQGCIDCLATGGVWKNLRMCLTCGYVGCCDSSPNKHASRHFRESGHPIFQSIQPGEDWRWCYLDKEFV